MDATILIPTEAAFSTRPIHVLPLELLVEIFLYLYKDPSVPRAEHDLRNTHKLTFIMLVCRAWKGIVERAPTLWTDIWVGRCPRYIEDEDTGQWRDYITTRFTRSGTLPLNVTILAAYVDLEEVSQLLLQHISRCKTLALRWPTDETNWDWTRNFRSNTPSIIHHILSSPLPMMQTIVIEEFAPQEEEEESDPRYGRLELDAPNLRDLTTESPDVIPFVKPQLPHLSTHNSLERLTIAVGWDDIVPNLPRDRLSLPNLKFLSVTYIDHLWTLLQAIDIPSLEHFVIDCALAEWPPEVDTVLPVMSELRELEWYTDPDATDEEPNLRHLLQHCPNITSLSYICNEESVESLREYLDQGLLFDPMMSSSILLTKTLGGTLEFCPNLRRLCIACAGFEEIQKLVLRRPMLEHLSMQQTKPKDTVVTSSKTLWSAKVKLVRWIRSKVQFEFPTNVWAVDEGLLEEEGVFWWDRKP